MYKTTRIHEYNKTKNGNHKMCPKKSLFNILDKKVDRVNYKIGNHRCELYYECGAILFKGKLKMNMNNITKRRQKKGLNSYGKIKIENIHGNGIIYFTNGLVQYKGKIVNGELSENGIFFSYYHNKKIKYRGQKKKCQKSGFGIQYYENGEIQYMGNFRKNKFHGKGVCFYKNKTKYIGTFINGEKHFGMLYNKNNDSTKYKIKIKNTPYINQWNNKQIIKRKINYEYDKKVLVKLSSKKTVNDRNNRNNRNNKHKTKVGSINYKDNGNLVIRKEIYRKPTKNYQYFLNRARKGYNLKKI